MRPVACLIHVDDVEAGLSWYQSAFPQSVLQIIDGFECLTVSGIALEIVNSDEKVSSGKAGTVLYWQVDDLKIEITRFKKLGSKLYRGPMSIGSDTGMCQVTDPFGNLIGLRGFYTG